MTHANIGKLIDTMQETSKLLSHTLDSRDQMALMAILGEPGNTLFGKPVIFHVEWPDGPPWPEEKLHAVAREFLDTIRRRREATIIADDDQGRTLLMCPSCGPDTP